MGGASASLLRQREIGGVGTSSQTSHACHSCDGDDLANGPIIIGFIPFHRPRSTGIPHPPLPPIHRPRRVCETAHVALSQVMSTRVDIYCRPSILTLYEFHAPECDPRAPVCS